ncbi:MAG: glutamyl-tRNA amidotransferase [Candidatus Nealsonbacteria bacterium CG_4_9_14_3_um_filter_35_11]|uniref:Glutamyl-tRNA amidotransferase n=2 Tax=Candidatus Nealsoniibacteriota TaxID=1817911 RepID=A0A2M7DAJ4_9BACT|nr:MAG: glutamyl-tRNA amidotransferase [Candidatus Nealsonbacteria bacterium CG11_big_fil_rev_8_21_14_0_20_35_11]PIV45476.1 MAG: glutamyl-tRNA amidotransferase [Candidatus Nealsonbacteria bacterium CG02_land_8_20_14_3_00_34_20]PIZ89735.1 MAG: glutamyl-tRNA amidotransferase [Candidatus Nealsonbacteria bacterium CG_4_10_14_0_2_um_filter_35_20]PJA84665.1 MAG: glutamyl-tRNA amidotransferase [Candidatus Nealsonbacteria bacterium CG_4_9_14_3_um_filter_35_11]
MLLENIKKDLVNAQKSKNEIRVSTLRMVLAAILNKEKEKRTKIAKQEKELEEKELIKKSQLNNEELIEVIFSEVKKRKEAILDFKKGKREDLVKKEKLELEILQRYLPRQLREEEIEKLAKEVIQKLGASKPRDIAKVMGALMPLIKGKADGALVSKIVRELLSSSN